MENVRDVAIDVASDAVEKLTGEAPAGDNISKAVDNVLSGKA